MPRRITNSKSWFVFTLSFLAMVASSIALVVTVAVNNHSARSTDRKICEGVNRVNITIIATLKRNEATIPKLQYYKDHPEELARQEAEIAAEIVKFQPLACNK